MSRFIQLVAIIGLLAGPLTAQELVGTLTGVASDETGAVLPGVAITLTHRETRRVITAATAAEGGYSVRIEPGRYSVRFELPKFRPVEVPEVDILAGHTSRLDATMTVGGVASIVEVLNRAPLIEVGATTIAHSITAEEVERLPSARTFQSLAIIAPKVQTGEIEGGIQINGASGAENAFIIDGVPTNSAIDGRSRQNAPPEYIQEIQIKTAGVEAEHGGALGGVIAAITKSGGGRFRGETHFYWTGDALAARPVKRLLLDGTYAQDEKGALDTYEAGFSLGGPLGRKGLYFFTSLSPRREHRTQIYRYDSGADPGEATRKQTFMSAFNKLSFDPAGRVRANVWWLWSPARSDGALLAYDGAGPNWISRSKAAAAPNEQIGFFSPQASYAGNLDFFLTPNIVVSGRAGRFWDNYKTTNVPATTSFMYQTAAAPPLVPPNLAGEIGRSNAPRLQTTEHDLTTRSYGQADISLSGAASGFHVLKAGFALQKSVNSVNAYYPNGYVDIWWDRSFVSPATGLQDRGTYGFYEVHDVRVRGSAGSTIRAIYVQDQWSVHPRLTLNFGVRLEQERIPSFRPDIQKYAFDFTWSDKIAPRIGAGLDLLGDGRLRLSGGWGRFYDWTKYDLARRIFGADVWRTYYRSLDTLDIGSLSLQNMPGRDLWNPGAAEFRDRIVPQFDSTSIDPGIKPLAQDQWNIGFDYQWNSSTVTGVRYLHQNLIRTIEDLAVSLPLGGGAFIYGNPGEGAAVLAASTGATASPIPHPKPVRLYDAVEFSATRRFSRGWFGSASYTWSRLFGNYAGLANSDEIRTPTTGVASAVTQQQAGSIARPGSYANYSWDLDEILFDSRGNLDPQGRLATDRPHALKINGGYERRWRSLGASEISSFFYLASGTPLSTKVLTTNGLPVLVNGRGDLGRTPVLNYTDLRIAHSFALGESQRIRLEITMLNVFNQKTARRRFDTLNRGAGVGDLASAMNLAGIDLRRGYDYRQLILARGADAFDPRYGADDLFQAGFSGRLGLKWTF